MRDKPSELYLWAVSFMRLLNIATGWLCCVTFFMGVASDWQM